VNEVDDLKKNKNNLFIEPALTVSGGSSKLKLQLQLQKSYNLSNAKFKYDDFSTLLGIEVFINEKLSCNKQKLVSFRIAV
jgi:hypothetical protein